MFGNAGTLEMRADNRAEQAPSHVLSGCVPGRQEGEGKGEGPWQKKACLFAGKEGGAPQLWVPCSGEERYTPHPDYGAIPSTTFPPVSGVGR
jgi:hypothetical protein